MQALVPYAAGAANAMAEYVHPRDVVDIVRTLYNEVPWRQLSDAARYRVDRALRDHWAEYQRLGRSSSSSQRTVSRIRSNPITRLLSLGKKHLKPTMYGRSRAPISFAGRALSVMGKSRPRRRSTYSGRKRTSYGRRINTRRRRYRRRPRTKFYV